MLSKLIKYELKATSRVFLPLYLALLVFGLVNRFTLGLSAANNWDTPAVISMLVYVLIMAGIFVMTLIMTVQRFYKNLLTEEGYLSFTLPVRPWQHIICKMLVSMLWVILSLFFAALSIILIAFKVEHWSSIAMELANLSKVFDYLGAYAYLYSLEGIIGIFLTVASASLILYASIALGHLFTKHRIMGSFAAFIGLNTLTQIVSMAAVFLLGLNMDMTITSANFWEMQSELQFLIWFLLIETALICAAYFAITNYILNKRLNLE